MKKNPYCFNKMQVCLRYLNLLAEKKIFALHDIDVGILIVSLYFFFFFLSKNKIPSLKGPKGLLLAAFAAASYSLVSLKMCHLIDMQDRSKALSNSLDRDNCSSSWERVH